MALSLEDIDFLRSDRARAILSAFADSDLSENNTLPLLSQLRDSLTLPEAFAVLNTLILRKKAASKFPRFAGAMLFTDDGLQQASHPSIRRYRAGLIESETVLDLCCGIGSDSLAFAASGRKVLGLDVAPLRIAIARHNAEVMGIPAQFEIADIRRGIPSGYDCIFFDPGRRDGQGKRIHHVERYLPPLSLVRDWRAQDIIVKLSPAVDLRQLEPYGGCLEFISLDGDLTEALLWLNRPTAPHFATRLTGQCRTSLLSSGGRARRIIAA